MASREAKDKRNAKDRDRRARDLAKPRKPKSIFKVNTPEQVASKLKLKIPASQQASSSPRSSAEQPTTTVSPRYALDPRNHTVTTSPEPLRRAFTPPKMASREALELISEHLPLSSLKNLALASKAAYQMFNPLLYRSICEPVRVEQLLFTLSRPLHSREQLGLHPALLVRKLGIHFYAEAPQYLSSARAKDKHIRHWDWMNRLAIAALVNVRENVELLHWRSNLALEELRDWLPQPGRYPHLRKLAISILDHAVDPLFLLTPNLESLEYEEFVGGRSDGHTSGDSTLPLILHGLPTASPNLHTLTLRSNRWTPRGGWEQERLRQDRIAYVDFLLTSLNSLRLPELRTVALEIDLDEDREQYPTELTFSPFIANHPTLHDLSMELRGQDLPDDALPCLRAYKGSVWDCIRVCSSTRPLEKLVIITDSTWGHWHSREPCSLDHKVDDALRDLFSLASNVADLHIVPGASGDCSTGYVVTPHVLDSMGKSCPMLRKLEIPMTADMASYTPGWAVFKNLQFLQLRVWCKLPRIINAHRIRFEKSGGSSLEDVWAADAYDAVILSQTSEDVFPSAEWVGSIERYLLPHLKGLRAVEVHLAGNWDSGFRNREQYHDPDHNIKYGFRIVHDGPDVAQAVLFDSVRGDGDGC